MAKALSQSAAIAQARELWPDFRAQREHCLLLDAWAGGRASKFYTPKSVASEYAELKKMAPTPWGSLVVTSLVQSLYVEGYRLPDGADNADAWSRHWQPNKMDSRQVPIHRALGTHGLAYVSTIPGTNPLFPDQKMVSIRGHQATNMMAWFDDDSELATWAMRGDLNISRNDDGSVSRRDWLFRLYDNKGNEYFLTADQDGNKDSWRWIDMRAHGMDFCPVFRAINIVNLQGEVMGEIEPNIPILARLDQDLYDRLIVQRWSSTKIRTIAGFAPPADPEEQKRLSLGLMQTDLLVSTNPETKFDTLDASDLGQFTTAREADVRDLAAVSQTPPHHLLGLSPNLSAEALAAAESALMRKVTERQHSLGEFWEDVMRACDIISGETLTLQDYSAQVQWADVESRSLNQVADALGKMAIQLGIPLEMLWRRVPSWTKADTEEAKALLQDNENAAMLAAIQEQLIAEQGAANTNPGQQSGASSGEPATSS